MTASRTSRVAIIGGGIIGCATAYYLSRTGSCEIVMIESDHIAAGASGYSAGILTPYSGSNDPDLLALSPAALALHAELAETLPAETGIDHGYDVRPFLRCAFGDDGEREAKSFMQARMAEGHAADWLSGDVARELCDWLSDDVIGACVTSIEPTVDSRLLTQSLFNAASDATSLEFINDEFTGITLLAKGAVGSISLDDQSQIEADAYVFALGPWSSDVSNMLRFGYPVVPQKGQLLHIDTGDASSDQMRPPVAMQNMDDGGVVLPRRVSSTVLGATREVTGYDREPSDFAYEYIIPRVQRLCPRIDASLVSRQTACLRPMPADGKPYVGPAHNQNNAFFAAGHWSEGIHYGPLTGKWLADTITTGSSDIDFSAIGTDRLPNFG